MNAIETFCQGVSNSNFHQRLGVPVNRVGRSDRVVTDADGVSNQGKHPVHLCPRRSPAPESPSVYRDKRAILDPKHHQLVARRKGVVTRVSLQWVTKIGMSVWNMGIQLCGTSHQGFPQQPSSPMSPVSTTLYLIIVTANLGGITAAEASSEARAGYAP